MDTIYLIEETHNDTDRWEVTSRIAEEYGFFVTGQAADTFVEELNSHVRRDYKKYILRMEQKNAVKANEKAEYEQQKALVEAAGMKFQGNMRTFTPDRHRDYDEWVQVEGKYTFESVRVELHTD